MKLSRILLAGVAALSLAPYEPAFAAGSAYTSTLMPTPSPPAGNCITMGTYPAVADSGVGCSNHTVTVSDGSHGTVSLNPTTYLSPGSPSILNGTSGQPLIFQKSVPLLITDVADFEFVRNANYSGGTPGYVNGSTRWLCQDQAGITAYEWCSTWVMDNYGTVGDGSQNVASYFQAKKHSTGSTWGITVEFQDFNADPSTSSVADEHDLTVTGTDAHTMRVIQDDFCKSKDGNPATCGYGERIIGDTNATINNGLYLSGNFLAGVNLSAANFAGGGLILGDSHELCFDNGACSNYLFRSGGVLYYHSASGNVFSWNDTGQFGASSLVLSGISGSTQCLQVNSSGLVSGTGATCAGGSSGGTVNINSGNKLCLDGTTCSYDLTLSGGNTIQINTSAGTAAQFTALQTNLLATTASQLDDTGRLSIASGQKFCLDGTTCANYLTQSAGTVTIAAGSQVSVGSLSASSVSTSGTETAGGFSTGGSVTASGTVSGGTVNSNGNVQVSQSNKLCLNGSSCTIYISFDGTNLNFVNNGSIKLGMNMSSGMLDTTGGYEVIASPGVNCSGTPTSSFAVSAGIVTHC